MVIAAIAAALLSGAAPASQADQAECVYDRDALLAMDFAAFDQTAGSGWRPLYEAGCYVEVAELLRDWRMMRDGEVPSIIPFHEAQMWGYAGEYEQAIALFAQVRHAEGSVYAIAFNLYVDGNLAFLRRDRAGLEAAVAALSAIPEPPGWSAARMPDGQPNSLPWPQNLNVLEALLRCWDATYEVAAHCHIPEWRAPRPAERPQ